MYVHNIESFSSSGINSSRASNGGCDESSFEFKASAPGTRVVATDVCGTFSLAGNSMHSQ